MEFPHTWELLQAELMDTATAPNNTDMDGQHWMAFKFPGRDEDSGGRGQHGGSNSSSHFHPVAA
jgi:hypothetical protein